MTKSAGAKPSANELALEALFGNRDPIVRAIYDEVMRVLNEWGSAQGEAKKSSVHLMRTTALAGFHPRARYALLEFKATTLLEDPRIIKVDQPSRSRFYHTVRLDSPSDVDGQVVAWLRGAWEMSG
ncbi:MAG: DUF5655 domain-containing protein [Caldilineaceae bacterium]